MEIKWLWEAQAEFNKAIAFRRNTVGAASAKKFYQTVLKEVSHLSAFPEIGATKVGSILSKHGFRVLFVESYACIYRVVETQVLIYHFVDARTNYILNIFGQNDP